MEFFVLCVIIILEKNIQRIGMFMKTFIFGHRNPDTDAICSAIAYADLKKQLGENCEAVKLGDIQRETKFVLDFFGVQEPKTLNNVKIQVQDLKYTKINTIEPENSILHAYREMEKQSLKTMAIVDNKDIFRGLVTMKDIAMDMIHGDFYNIDTTIENILEALDAKQIVLDDKKMLVNGKVVVVAFYLASLEGVITDNSIVIVGDRYDVIEMAIEKNVKLIIVSGGFDIPEHLTKLAEEKNIPMLVSKHDTYIVSKLIQQCNFVSTIIKNKSLIKFEEDDYLDEVKDDIIRSNHRNFPVLDDNGKFLGFVGRKHLLNPGRKQVILVDHNEFGQSAKGIEEAEILEILDHHKIGGLNTSMPIRFINSPLGSTCTIIYLQFKQNGIVPSREMAGVMISGILSDTLHFKSPTCTIKDQEAVRELNEIAKLDIEEYFMQMFKEGTAIDGFTEEEILHRDFKDFKIKDYKIGISQIFTLNIDDVLKRQEQLLSYMQKEKESNNYEAILFAVTDIVREGSYFFYASDIEGILNGTFEIEDVQGAFAPWIVSRKKQIVPKLMAFIYS